MNVALVAVIALVVALVLSATTKHNVGLLAIALAWIVGVYLAKLKPDAVAGGFPATLFITLAGVTLLFGIAQSNGTLDLVATRAAALVRGNARLLPILFFNLAGALSSVGPGAISSVALVAPIAMAAGARAGVSPFLMAICVATGANAGNLSPFSAVGAMANSILAKQGLAGHEGKVWAANFIAHVIVAAAAYAIWGRQTEYRQPTAAPESGAKPVATIALEHRVTIAVIALWMAAVVLFKVSVGLSAFAAAVALLLSRAADEADSIKRIPLDVILMVTGVSMLIAVLESTGGLNLFSGMVAKVASPSTLNAVIAFVTGILSTYSSTSGVILPAFLPMVPSLTTQVGATDPLAVALSIDVGSSLVDVSPLSTLGALCVAALPDRTYAPKLFRQLLIWGLSMAVVGAILAGLLAGPFARL